MQGTHLACLRVQADDRIHGHLVGPHEASAIDRYGIRQWRWHSRSGPKNREGVPQAARPAGESRA